MFMNIILHLLVLLAVVVMPNCEILNDMRAKDISIFVVATVMMYD